MSLSAETNRYKLTQEQTEMPSQTIPSPTFKPISVSYETIFEPKVSRSDNVVIWSADEPLKTTEISVEPEAHMEPSRQKQEALRRERLMEIALTPNDQPLYPEEEVVRQRVSSIDPKHLEIAKAFFENNKDRAATASSLGISRSDVHYALKRCVYFLSKDKIKKINLEAQRKMDIAAAALAPEDQKLPPGLEIYRQNLRFATEGERRRFGKRYIEEKSARRIAK
jgi:hypothetical protein